MVKPTSLSTPEPQEIDGHSAGQWIMPDLLTSLDNDFELPDCGLVPIHSNFLPVHSKVTTVYSTPGSCLYDVIKTSPHREKEINVLVSNSTFHFCLALG